MELPQQAGSERRCPKGVGEGGGWAVGHPVGLVYLSFCVGNLEGGNNSCVSVCLGLCWALFEL